MKRQLLALFVSLILVASQILSTIPLVAAAAGVSRFDLDVIFVIDNSGSMNYADPDKLALSASNLFIDMCEGSDSRVGFVMFTHQIAADQPLTDIENFSQELKQAITRTKYQSNGNTDTALGLERAYELFEQDALGGKSDRKQVAILLSDGNTDLKSNNPRTTEESLAALENIKKKYADAGIPIHTIGFNFDGTLDIKAMKAVAEVTDATFQEVKTADRLPSVLRNIYGHLTGANSKNTTLSATGQPQTADIPIDNESIYKATVTISSSKPIKNANVTDPAGNVYDISTLSKNVSVNEDPNHKYILFTLYRPSKGTWKLNFTGTENDIVLIDLLSVYDSVLVFEPPVTTATPPGDTQISWHLEDDTGNNNTDVDLINSLIITLHTKSLDDGSEKEYIFTQGQTSEAFHLPPGDYEAFLTMESNDINEDNTSNTRTFNVPELITIPPIELRNQSDDTISVKLITIIKPNYILYLDDYVRYTSDDEPLSVSYGAGDWNDFIECGYELNNNQINISALNSGKTVNEITVTNASGDSSVTLFLNVTVTSGLLYFAIAGGILLILAVVIIIIILSRRPYLDNPMRGFNIEVRNLPEGLEYPQAAELRFEHVKAKRSLQQIIDYNRAFANEYFSAFRDLGWFLAGTEFSAKSKTETNIVIPVYPRFSLHIDGQHQMKPYSNIFNKNRELRITLIQDEYNIFYEIILGKNDIGFGNDPWGTGGGTDFTGTGNYGQGSYGGVPQDDFDLF